MSVQKSAQLLAAARRIILSFKSSVSGDPSIYYEMMERLVLGNS